MRILDELKRPGAFFFRWRSYVPLLLLFPAAAALTHGIVIERYFGDAVEDAVVLTSYAISLAGLAVRWATIAYAAPGTSGRGTKQKADTLNTTGMYSIVRNPLYLGNCIVVLGMLLAIKSWWFVLAGGLVYVWFIHHLIDAEEEYLSGKFGAAYAGWAARTPALIPRFSLWRRPERAFSWRMLLRREYYGVMTVAAFYLCNEVAEDLLVERDQFSAWLKDDWFWVAQFFAASAIFFVLRHLKKRTTLLQV